MAWLTTSLPKAQWCMWPASVQKAMGLIFSGDSRVFLCFFLITCWSFLLIFSNSLAYKIQFNALISLFYNILGAWDTEGLAKVLVCGETWNVAHLQKCKGIFHIRVTVFEHWHWHKSCTPNENYRKKKKGNCKSSQMLLNVLVVWCGVHYRSHWGGVCVCVCVWKGGGGGG